MPAFNVQVDAAVALSVGGSNEAGGELLHERFLSPLIQRMPTGRAWRTLERSTVMHALLRGLARCFGRIDVYERTMIAQLDPSTSTFGLNDWERVLDLDPGGMTLAERRSAVIAALRARGGQSIPYWVEFMENLGYTNVVVTPLEDRFRMGDPIRKRLQGNAWAFAMQITADSMGGAMDDYVSELVEAALRGTVYVWFEFV